MAKKKSFEKLAFLTPAFNYKGVEYKAAELEKLIAAGDEAAIALVEELQALGHVVPAGEEIKPVATQADINAALEKVSSLEEENAKLQAELKALKNETE